MIPDARSLFERMRSDRTDERRSSKVFRVNEAPTAINSAVHKLGLPRVTHHDLRHLFATASIESGVQYPRCFLFDHAEGLHLIN